MLCEDIDSMCDVVKLYNKKCTELGSATGVTYDECNKDVVTDKPDFTTDKSKVTSSKSTDTDITKEQPSEITDEPTETSTKDDNIALEATSKAEEATTKETITDKKPVTDKPRTSLTTGVDNIVQTREGEEPTGAVTNKDSTLTTARPFSSDGRDVTTEAPVTIEPDVTTEQPEASTEEPKVTKVEPVVKTEEPTSFTITKADHGDFNYSKSTAEPSVEEPTTESSAEESTTRPDERETAVTPTDVTTVEPVIPAEGSCAGNATYRIAVEDTCTNVIMGPNSNYECNEVSIF